MAKLGFIVPWNKIQKVQVAAYQTSKVMAVFTTSKGRCRLIFPQHRLKNLVYELQKHVSEVLIEESLKL